MEWKSARLHAWLNIASAVVMLAGLGCAAYIYQTGGDESTDTLGYDFHGGSPNPIRPEDSKKYQRDLEVISGKAGVVMDDIRRGFAALWQGKSLAYMVAALSILVSFGLYFTANRLPPGPKKDGPGNIDRNGP
jgi:hypothetical protein